MKKALVFAFAASLTTAAFAQNIDINHSNLKAQPANGFAGSQAGTSSNLIYHTGGTVIRNAKVVLIFWGPTFAAGGADNTYATQIQAFRTAFGTTGEYNTITQYYGEDPVSGYGNIALSNLLGAQPDMFDTTTPPQNVSDATVQSEVKKYIAAHGTDYNTVYEVFLPKTSFSSDGRDASCGAVKPYRLSYCAYHSHYSDASGKNVKYSIEPYPSCSGCSVTGFTAPQNQEHFVCHETREAVTDALGNAWFDGTGYEADDKCAWTPSPFIGTGGFAYQYEWSNADAACVKTK